MHLARPDTGTNAGTWVWRARWVLSVAKLRVGQEAYQLTGVAQSLDDYYTGEGEASGWWAGLGAERLGLEGEVAGDDLRAVLAGFAPGSGGLSPNGEEIRPHPRRVPGFDLTFKAPKSLSVLYAVSDDPRVQGAIIEGCEAAVRSTLAWLEREAIRVRRGTGNERWLANLAARDPLAAEQARVRVQPGRGLAAAVFRHRTSRAGDPLLHWHALVPNLVEGPDGRWSAFVHPELYRHVRAAGEVFQAAVRAEVTARLGVAWRPGRHVPEVAGVPEVVCEQFSKRSKEVRAWLAAHGRSDGAEARQAAVLATRRHKPEREGERLDVAWKAEALAAGWGPDAAEALVASLAPPGGERAEAVGAGEGLWRLPEWADAAGGDPVLYDRVVTGEEWVRELLAEDLVAGDSTFTRPDVARAVAARLGEGATPVTVDRVVSRVLASPEVVPVHDADVARWTSLGHLAVERRLLDAVSATRGARWPVPSRDVEQALARRATIGDDQAAAVRTLTSSRDAVTVLVGPAGTGKTYVLDAVRAAYEAAGYRVVGAAPTGRAALELGAGANLPASTLHRLRARWESGIDRPGPTTALVIDEAGMAAVGDLEPLVTATVAAGGRVILAGDHRQLPEIGAGGAFGNVATTRDTTVATLSVNRRQTRKWEREALAQLRDGDVAGAVDAYRAQGRVVVCDDGEAMVAAGTDKWFASRDGGRRAVLLAGTNDVVDALNDAVRHRLIERGELPGVPVATSRGNDLAIGDRVVLRRTLYGHPTSNGNREGIFNAEAATVTGALPGGHGVTVTLDHDGATTTLAPHYLDAGHLSYGYALTTHRSQGGTWDVAIAVGTDGLYQEAGYTQLSRGKEANWLVVTRPELDDLDAELGRHDSAIRLPVEDRDALDEVTGRLHRSRAKLLALARDPHADHVNALAGVRHLADLEARALFCRAVEQDATRATGVDPQALGRRHAQARHTATHLAVGHRVRALDRGNIGTIAGYDDPAGTVTVFFKSPDGKEATVELDWADVHVVVPRDPPPRALTPAARRHLDTLEGATRAQVERWHAHLAAHGVAALEAQHSERAATLAVDRTAAHLAADPPPWLLDALGRRPQAPFAARVWDDTVRAVAAHHARHHLPLDQPDGYPNADAARANSWAEVTTRLADTRTWIYTHDHGTRPLARTRSAGELGHRLRELDALLATAPPDQRGAIRALLAGAQSLDGDTTARLHDALAAHQGRKDWIVAHWPYVVEHAEATRALATGTPGAPVAPALDHAATHGHPALTDAAVRQEPWLSTLLGQLADPDGHVTADTLDLLGDIATHRARWAIDHPDPLGPAADDQHEAHERARLATAIESARQRAHAVDADSVVAATLDGLGS
jgi:conjugative relaxase-like TrwC/TraI family protein